MQLKIRRTQRLSTWGSPLFCMDIRADYTREEVEHINKYRLGNLLIYSSAAANRHREAAREQFDRGHDGGRSAAAGIARGMFSAALAKMALNVSVASLAKGHHIECKDLEELLDAEEVLRGACRDLTRYLDVASTFNGSEIVIDYHNGEEAEHIAALEMPVSAPASDIPAAVVAIEARPAAPTPAAPQLPPQPIIVATGRDYETAMLDYPGPEPVMIGGLGSTMKDTSALYIAGGLIISMVLAMIALAIVAGH